MELMTSLLLCAVLAFPPLAFAESTIQYAEFGPIRIVNNSMNFRSNPILPTAIIGVRSSLRKKINDDLSRLSCKNCDSCMKRAVKDFKFKTQTANEHPETNDFPEETEEIITGYNEVGRYKRESDFIDETKPDEMLLKAKKGKSKKNKINKTVTVTRYNVDREITALKVKETQVAGDQLDDTLATSTCQVYSVKKSYPCDSPESDLILAASRRKVNKKSKKEKEKNKIITSTEKSNRGSQFMAAVFRKREVDNSQIPENVMPSIEEMY